MDLLDKHAWMIGVQVKIKTHLGEDLEGEIYSYDNITNCLVLQYPQKHTFRLIKTSFIKEAHVLHPSEGDFDAVLPPINLNRVKSREDHALKVAYQDAARIGVGVTAQAQEIFNALSKTLPCRWHGDVIIVFEDIRIVSPYALGNVSGADAAALNRVKKVLEGERKKLGIGK